MVDLSDDDLASVWRAMPDHAPNDPQWMAFVSWAQKQWGQEAWRHTSNTCGEWDAWQAGRMAERAAIDAAPSAKDKP